MQATDISRILNDCEDSIRGLAATVTAEGKYDDALILVQLAKDLAKVRERYSTTIIETDSQEANQPRVTLRMATGKEPAEKTKEKTQARKQPKKRATRKSGYPKFYRHKQDLVKVGWSKRKSEEYSHKAPKLALDLLANAIVEIGTQRDLFTAEDLFPLKESNTMTEVPSYQAYLCLAWLRKEELIIQVGRQGYRLAHPKDLKERVEGRWQELPSK